MFLYADETDLLRKDTDLLRKDTDENGFKLSLSNK